MNIINKIHQELSINSRIFDNEKYLFYLESKNLLEINSGGKNHFLDIRAAKSWKEMSVSATLDGILIYIISGFRSYEYQKQIFLRKLNSGQSIENILQVNAPPGYSEHHSGQAVDIGTDDCEPLVEEFEETKAFKWLQKNAYKYNFFLSYPRNNQKGVIYEPWHWCFRI